MSKYTKGPWYFGAFILNSDKPVEVPFCYIGEGWSGNPGIYSASGKPIVCCDEYYIFGGEANARLLCAAPDLLEALKDLYADYKKLADSGNWQLEKTDVGKKARAAIRKATK
jgi:hypothetical protein